MAANLEGASLISQNRLYIDVGTEKKPIIYDDLYNISFWGLENLHPFDSKKWGRIIKILLEKEFLKSDDIIKPVEANEEDLLQVHTSRYLTSLTWSATVARVTEVVPVGCIPNRIVQYVLLRKLRLQTGGTVLAAKVAVGRGWSINVGGGFHHCSSDEGGGFCAYADITLAIKMLQQNDKSIKKVMIIDLDAHQGNGHERDFMDDENIYIMDVYNASIYPGDRYAKAAIKKKVELAHFTKDKEYLRLVDRNLKEALEDFTPDFVVYNAGTDILDGDPLGNLSISAKGIVKRDEIVFRELRERQIPVTMVTSGGYQRSTAEVIADSIVNLRNVGLLTEKESIP